MNRKLFFGDNLAVMREHISDQSVDLIYLDPPFNSDARYNVLFQSPDEKRASAQAEAFRDTWTWDQEAEWALDDIADIGGSLATFVNAIFSALGRSDMMAYLVMMAVRVHELRRVLKPTGTLYLHCDPTASHYLKVILDGIFQPSNFSNEIIWQRTSAKSLATRRLPTNHDVILRYTGGSSPKWNAEAAYIPYDVNDLPEKTAKKYCYVDEKGRRYALDNLLNPNKDRPNLHYEFLGVTRTWRWTKERMEKAYEDGLIHQSAPGRVPRHKRFLDERKGLPLSDVWSDIFPLNSQAKERLGYPTQKPLKLLERIIEMSSDPGDVVLDPFCGCGTTVHAATQLKRNWVGIDIAYHAIEVISDRLNNHFDLVADQDYELGGRPNDLASAQRLADRDKYQFQWWANYLVGVQQMKEVRRGPDRGIDGEIFYRAGPGKGFGRILTSVKGGKHVGASDVRDFRGVLEREGADGGVFICLRRPTRDMLSNAASAGFFTVGSRKFSRMQILSIEELFEDGKMLDLPHRAPIAQRARKNRTRAKVNLRRADPRQPEFKLLFDGDAKGKTEGVHLNPRTAFEGDGFEEVI